MRSYLLEKERIFIVEVARGEEIAPVRCKQGT
jgi:hypothetical protein